MMTNTYRKIKEARTILELPEKATMAEIKTSYRSLIRKWHPDRCKKTKAECTEMTTRIITAYRIIYDYCKHYKFSFAKEEIRNYISDQEWWVERFGYGPLWEDEKKEK